MAPKKRFTGAVYYRGGSVHDRWGNIKKEKITYRDPNSKAVYDGNGKLLGFEENRKHTYGTDYKKKKPKGWHGESIRHSLVKRLKR